MIAKGSLNQVGSAGGFGTRILSRCGGHIWPRRCPREPRVALRVNPTAKAQHERGAWTSQEESGQGSWNSPKYDLGMQVSSTERAKSKVMAGGFHRGDRSGRGDFTARVKKVGAAGGLHRKSRGGAAGEFHRGSKGNGRWISRQDQKVGEFYRESKWTRSG
jgi:hypothetical protein